MSRWHDPANEPESLQELEALIAAAGDYVMPADTLRPRVLEAARVRQNHRHSAWRMFQMAGFVFVCLLASIPAQHHLEAWRNSAFSPSADEMELLAQEYADQPAIGQNWGFYEAFKDLRHDQMLKIVGRQ